MEKEQTFKIVKEDGTTLVYRIIMAFKWLKTNKNYLVYTDDTLDENGNLNIYASIYYLDDDTKLDPVETEEEWNEIDNRLRIISNQDV